MFKLLYKRCLRLLKDAKIHWAGYSLKEEIMFTEIKPYSLGFPTFQGHHILPGEEYISFLPPQPPWPLEIKSRTLH